VVQVLVRSALVAIVVGVLVWLLVDSFYWGLIIAVVAGAATWAVARFVR
jgi:hypothetical protein